jgi:hypothetical protein
MNVWRSLSCNAVLPILGSVLIVEDAQHMLKGRYTTGTFDPERDALTRFSASSRPSTATWHGLISP